MNCQGRFRDLPAGRVRPGVVSSSGAALAAITTKQAKEDG